MTTSATLIAQGAGAAITPGTQTTLSAVITNTGTATETFALSARDIEPAWLTFRPPALTLAPGQQGAASILLTVPAGAPLTDAPRATAATVPFAHRRRQAVSPVAANRPR